MVEKIRVFRVEHPDGADFIAKDWSDVAAFLDGEVDEYLQESDVGPAFSIRREYMDAAEYAALPDWQP